MFYYALSSDALTDINQSINKEWIVTNGLGSFASSTLSGCNTRRYHSLLTASRPQDPERMVILSKLEESLIIGDKTFNLSTNKYQEQCIHPRGYVHLRKFQLNPFPKFTFSIENIILAKEIFMAYNSNTTVIRYEIISTDKIPFTFEVLPLIACRNFHELKTENSNFCKKHEYSNFTLKMKPYEDAPEFYLKAKDMEFNPLNIWYKNFKYDIEEERGLDFVEDLFNPGNFSSSPSTHLKVDFIVTIENKVPKDIELEYKKVKERNKEICNSVIFDSSDEHGYINEKNALLQAADKHIIKRTFSNNESITTIIAGYPWFGDWGRDTFISLTGLTLVTNRFDEAREILTFFSKKCKNGLIPNKFADIGSLPAYNTVDASLWFINAVYQYAKFTGDYDFIKENLYNCCKSIIENYKNGTDYNIHMDEDYLISAGSEGVQLTWMDAIVDGKVITPRHGKPVEINALWYNALCIIKELAVKFNDDPSSYEDLSKKVSENFNEKFWYQREGYLFDNINQNLTDMSIRPNQLYAISLSYPVLKEKRWKSVLNIVQRKLYTPYGIRSLDKDNLRYKAFYTGPPEERDAAYHMGVAWGYLMGVFIEAYIKTKKYSSSSISKAKIFLDTWMSNLYNDGIGTLSEIFDGDEPYTPRGCFSQAWTVAEALRIKYLLNKFDNNNKTN